MPEGRGASASRAQRIAAATIAVGLGVLALKTAAWLVTGSVALFSDALESTVNVAASVAAFLAVRWSDKPADANHPYGHHKAEYFAAVAEGVLIIVAALLVFHEAWQALLDPRPLDLPPAGIALSVLATLVNGAWAVFLVRAARRLRSPALAADGRHLVADVVTTLGVLTGLGLALLTGLVILDPLIAAAVALHILWSGWQVTRESLGGLMDAAAPEDELARIRQTISETAEGAIEAHDLRTRHAGRVTFVEFHLVVPGDMTVAAAHAICDRVEEALKGEIDDAVITIHVEPQDKAKHTGIVVL